MKTRADRNKDPALDQQCLDIETAALLRFQRTGEKTLVTPRLLMECATLGMDTSNMDGGQ